MTKPDNTSPVYLTNLPEAFNPDPISRAKDNAVLPLNTVEGVPVAPSIVQLHDQYLAGYLDFDESKTEGKHKKSFLSYLVDRAYSLTAGPERDYICSIVKKLSSEYHAKEFKHFKDLARETLWRQLLFKQSWHTNQLRSHLNWAWREFKKNKPLLIYIGAGALVGTGVLLAIIL